MEFKNFINIYVQFFKYILVCNKRFLRYMYKLFFKGYSVLYFLVNCIGVEKV